MDSNSKIIDLSYLKEMSSNNKDIIVEMIEIFIEQTPEFTEGISNHFKNRQWTELSAVAHKAKSSVKIMGMDKLGDCLEKIEHYSRGNKKIELQHKISDNHKLNNDDLRTWNNIRNEEVNDINLKHIPQLVSYFLNQNSIAISELKKAILEL